MYLIMHPISLGIPQIRHCHTRPEWVCGTCAADAECSDHIFSVEVIYTENVCVWLSVSVLSQVWVTLSVLAPDECDSAVSCIYSISFSIGTLIYICSRSFMQMIHRPIFGSLRHWLGIEMVECEVAGLPCRCDIVVLKLVFASPVQSGFFALFGRTATATSCLLWQDPKKPDWTAKNRSKPV